MKKLFLFVFLGFSDLSFAVIHVDCSGMEPRQEIQIRDVTTPGHPDRVRSVFPIAEICRRIAVAGLNPDAADPENPKKPGTAGCPEKIASLLPGTGRVVIALTVSDRLLPDCSFKPFRE